MKYEEIKSSKMDGKVYYDSFREIYQSLIPTPFKSNHANCLLPLDNGDMIAVWFAGSDEGNSDISIVESIFHSDTSTWSEAQQITFDPDRSEQNPSLFLHPNGEIWLIYTAQLARQKAQEEYFNLQYTSEIRRKISKDNGRTWSEYDVLFSKAGSFCRQPIQILSSGRWVFPTWICFNDKSHNETDITEMQISDDQGKTWRTVRVPNSLGKVHANIVESTPGHLIAFFRSRSADYIYKSISTDNGDSWSDPIKTELPNNNSSISAIKLSSGKIAIVYNELRMNKNPEVVVWPFERPSVSIAVSDDEGETFPWKRVVELGDGFYGRKNLRSNHRYEYPYIAQHKDQILVSYSHYSRVCIKIMAFEEKWIYGEYQEVNGDCKLWK